jgi:purine catabolism regulator
MLLVCALSTGIALPESDTALASYVAELAGVGVAGLAIELGRRYSVALPTSHAGRSWHGHFAHLYAISNPFAIVSRVS